MDTPTKSQVDINASNLDRTNYFVRNKHVLDYLSNIDKNSSILEVGCGNGDLSRELRNIGFTNLSLLDILDNSNGLNPQLADVSFDKLPYQDGQFDIVLAIAIIEHLENPFLFYREACRVTKPGGLFILAIPHALSLKSRIKFLFSGDLIGYSEKNNHISVFTKGIFAKTVLSKFLIQDTFYSNGYIQIFGKKIRFNKTNKFLGKLFGNKVLYILRKK